MKLTRLARYTVLALTLGCGLAAWPADSPAPAQPPSTLGSFQIYVGSFNAQQVNTYNPAHNQPGKVLLDGLYNITGGIAVDKLQNIYVTTGSGWVVVYPPPVWCPSCATSFRTSTSRL